MEVVQWAVCQDEQRSMEALAAGDSEDWEGCGAEPSMPGLEYGDRPVGDDARQDGDADHAECNGNAPRASNNSPSRVRCLRGLTLTLTLTLIAIACEVPTGLLLGSEGGGDIPLVPIVTFKP